MSAEGVSIEPIVLAISTEWNCAVACVFLKNIRTLLLYNKVGSGPGQTDLLCRETDMRDHTDSQTSG